MRLTGGTALCLRARCLLSCSGSTQEIPHFLFVPLYIETCIFFLFRFRCMRVMTCVSRIDIVLTFFFTTPASIEEFKFASLCSSVCPTFNNLF